MTPVLVGHDPGCRYAREPLGGHSDAAKRLSDQYNLHIAAGGRLGQVFAVRLSDGTSDGELYDSRAAAVRYQHHNERWYAFVRLGAPRMTVCEAASTLRFQAHQSRLGLADRDAPNGGLEVIPRLTIEDQERQLAAMAGLIRAPIALGYSKELPR